MAWGPRRRERSEQVSHLAEGCSRIVVEKALPTSAAQKNVAGVTVFLAGRPPGEVRAGELEGHPFFVATLFQPEPAALTGAEHPLVAAFVAAALGP